MKKPTTPDCFRPMTESERAAYRLGIEAAASFIESWQGQIDTDHVLADIVRAKFNMLAKSKMRKAQGGRAQVLAKTQAAAFRARIESLNQELASLRDAGESIIAWLNGYHRAVTTKRSP